MAFLIDVIKCYTNVPDTLSDVCADLCSASLCVPIIDKYSPLAYAIVNEVHWYNYDACHSGNETVMRFVLKIAFVIEGRSLIQQFRNDCPRCRFLNKKSDIRSRLHEFGVLFEVCPVGAHYMHGKVERKI